ncbi:hypothetical protein T310_0263 [Rasamsonia emersonii CBS 393.64]|uniref:Uncharacterized protein n=1 Tax=Rasamsonia emersonii (strain ATCC 16479 / CBS 393.64 / IMI 116815) TaxID=1408163 RepID=A0A0F4Z5D4_RASE3|nr:hypothetical protein T310_0263 [Rasamsonia emersonii CBS 393.64]KKA25707.1 hypothetical protein T310_0263 [Rasamsonia emersonii CBS 393.64]
MHPNDPSPFATPTSTLKKRKRDGTTWNNENLSTEHTGFMIHQGQLDCHHDVDHDMDLNLSPISTPGRDCSRSPRKNDRILQPSQQQQQQQQSPNPSSRSPSPPPLPNGQSRKPQPPSLLIPPSYTSSNSAALKASPEVSPRTVSPLPPPLLRPCHICHRRPTTRVMLDAYADCELCGERACYICLRECNAVGCGSTSSSATAATWSGPTTPEGGGGGGGGGGGSSGGEITIKNGYLYARQDQQQQQEQQGQHRQRKICSCCAVEGLTETGDEIVWCLDCVRGRYPSWE